MIPLDDFVGSMTAIAKDDTSLMDVELEDEPTPLMSHGGNELSAVVCPSCGVVWWGPIGEMPSYRSGYFGRSPWNMRQLWAGDWVEGIMECHGTLYAPKSCGRFLIIRKVKSESKKENQ